MNLEGNSFPQIDENQLFQKNPHLENVKLPNNKVLKKPSSELATTTSTSDRVEETEVDVENDIPCRYGNNHWQFTGSEIFTCDIVTSIDDSRMKIKKSPRNQRVEGLNFIDNLNVKFLPSNLGEVFPNLIGVSGYNR